MNESCDKCPRSVTGCLKYMMGLSPEELRDWCMARKAALDLSNQDIADAANLSKRTVDRFLASDPRDFRFSSVQPILIALLSDFDCVADDGKAEDYDGFMREERNKMISSVRFHRKIILVLSIALAVCLLTICAALIVDRLYLDRGFFWLER